MVDQNSVPDEALRIDTVHRSSEQHSDHECRRHSPGDATALEVESSWQEQPVHLPTYTPSTAENETARDSPPTTPVDDPIHISGSKKHFGFSARQSVASSIFPWQKHKPAVCHQYAPHRPPLSKRSSLSGLKVLPGMRAEPVKHLENEELDLLNLKSDQLAKRTLELLHLMDVQDWADVTDYRSLDLFRISGALTNCIFLVTGPPRGVVPGSTTATATNLDKSSQDNKSSNGSTPRKVLLRVYGVGLESLISREEELQWLQNLSTMQIGPSLLGIFKNGRFEEYVESTTLTKEDIRHPRTSRHIAHRMCELHNIVNVFPPPEDCIPQSQANIARWIPLAREAIEKICAKDPAKRAVMDEFDFEKLLVEIDEVHRELTEVHSPLVFAHNDTQYGNILRTKDESGELVVIDFEYAGYNTRGFDISNHFCEWTADYHSDRPSVLHPNQYPTKAEQLNFLEAYMEAEIAMCGYHLTAINLSKYAKKRRSITSAIASSLTKATLSAIQATSAALKKRATGEGALHEDKNINGSNNNNNTTTYNNNNTNSNGTPATASTTTAEDTTSNRTTLVFADGVVVGEPAAQKINSKHNRISNGSSNGNGNGSKGNNSALENDRLSLQRNRRRGSGGGDGSGGVSKAEILDSMYKEVNKFALTSHIMWGLWGLIQASQSEIDFDYFEYSLQRLSEFRRRRDEFMSL
ncbi:kinase-like domain-containing protein [Dissophora ornata]|nr:hypothetical protein BGZ58_001334 [Dissophora ornata]KAI8595535.1 kinase-like domain-containing protein [Dissophora ornata]